MGRLWALLLAPLTGWISFAVLATLIVLKLVRVIDWSWGVVLIPLWLSMGVGLVVGGVAMVVLVISARRGGG